MLRNEVVIYILAEPIVDAKVKVHLLKNVEHCDYTRKAGGGPRG